MKSVGNTSKSLNILGPFKYLIIGFIATVSFIFNFISWICIGAYYLVSYLLLKPVHAFFSILSNIYYQLFTSGHVKKEKELKLSVNFDENGEEVSSASPSKNNKDLLSQMKNNKKNLKEKQKAIVLNAKQKEKLDIERESLLKMINEGSEKRFEKPQTFRYKALDPNGKVVTSTFMGVSKLDIYTFLTGEGYTVFSIETSNSINFLYGESSLSRKKMSTKDLIFFITQLATYIKSGITLTEAMRILSKQMNKNKGQQQIMQSIVYHLTMGESFSNALERQTGVFPNLLINMMKAAEAAGNLDETLDDLGDYYTEMDSTRKQMKSAMTYPVIIALFSIVVVGFIMIYIVPQFVGIYETAGAQVNPLTQFVIDFSNFLQNYIFVILLIAVLIIVIFILAYKNVTSFKRSVQVALMHTPVVKSIIIDNELTIFTKTFASLLKNDVFITDCIEILRKLTNNEIYKEIMVNTITNIAKGEKISESFKNHWAIPDIAYYMIVTGENTGQLANMMSKVSAYYQEQHKSVIESMKSLIEPILIVFLAVVVGGVLIAVVIPMFSLYGSIA